MQYGKSEIILLVVMIAMFSGFMISFLIKMFRLLQKKEILHETELNNAKYRFEKELYKAQLESQEQTFVEISREIHDNVGQFLSLAKLGLSTLDLTCKKEAKEGIDEVNDILEKCLSDLRDISRAMNSELVKKVGLKCAIETQVGFLKRSGQYHVQFDAKGEANTSNQEKELIIYRILQESVNNIIKHARASEIFIVLTFLKNEIKLLIEDNGSGFDAEVAFSNKMRSGIINMRARANLINAEFSIESQLGKGTKVSVISPL